tara:strand:- start:545 stop:1174 length:630 start_codon:yes stop_codon:yes gene_type:complete
MASNNNELHEIALENLNLLVREEKNITKSVFVSDGKKLDVVKDQNGYDTMFTLKELEYPVYFTFQHFMNVIVDRNDLSYRRRKELLGILDDVFDSLCDLSESRETQNKDSEDKSLNSFQCVLNDISDRLDTVREQTLVTRCERMYLFFDEFVEALRIVSDQLYVSPFDADDEEEEEEELLHDEDKEVPEKKKPDSLFSGFWFSTLDKLD